MAAKRFLDNDSDPDHHKPNDKRIRTTTTTRPSFASIIGEVVMVKNMQNVFSSLEPLLRRVVTEEVERVMRHCYPPRAITRSPSLRIESVGQPHSNLYLMFTKPLSLPIFTGSRILDADGNTIQVVLVEKNGGDHVVRTSVPHSIKLELVVLDGDFPAAGDKEAWWTTEEFNGRIVKERAGKRPLLTGELNLTLRDGIAPIGGDIEFTDNSSWIRSRKFRVGVRVAPGGSVGGVRIREGFTEAFMVKDHRGELYKKHHPPMLEDEVWRLEKIGKDGAFHKKLSSHGVHTVQDFLKLSILGIGMSEKMWEVTMKHARTCEMGNKLYVYRGSNFAIYLNPICQIIKAQINGILYWGKEITNNMNKTYIHKLWGEAYSRWGCLEEVDEVLNDNIALLTQGESNVEQFGNNNHQATLYDENDFFGEKCSEVSSYGTNNTNNNNNAQIGGGGCNNNEWTLNPTFLPAQFVNGNISYSFSDSQSDGDLTPSDHVAATTRWP
ncbi:protein SAR DEFICIENT 1-like [Senna tora]|uniref:Protein SAR DEFICIENT 1-like n=1 Tax=Senna tora TaxID=362788 RepID=A0A834TDE0_9FABA|nr:protein SAR DEFICIENT 1-like [Senna tora]